MSHILVVEDEAIIRHTIVRLLKRHRHEVSEADTLDAAKQFNLDDFDLVISDLRLPGGSGTELLEMGSKTPILIMTSFASLKSAVDAMRMGAVDYIAKPFDHDDMLAAVNRILSESAACDAGETQVIRQQIEANIQTSGIIGSCDPMLLLFKKIQKVSPTTATVMIQGESGTGKELVAKAIHNNSERRGKAMISVNCAAIPETLIESELFGHEKGAFTGANSQRQGLIEAADGGTLFLDEIGELPLEAQARLLRVLQENEIRRVGSVQSQTVDVRLVVATHRNLRQLASQGKFREDLYYRLNVVELELPPLRERGDDVLEIADYLLRLCCEKMQRQALTLSAEAKQLIRQHNWPGNVRELENAIERAIIMNDGDTINSESLAIKQATSTSPYDVSDLMQQATAASISSPSMPPPSAQEQTDLSLDDYFVHFVQENEHVMTESEMARKLGISRKSLWERRQRLGIPRKKDP